jgi:hypothetical protein
VYVGARDSNGKSLCKRERERERKRERESERKMKR